MKKTTYLCLTLLLLVATAYGQEQKQVLFIGNSYTEVNNLPSLVKSIANSNFDDITYESNTPGGCTFAQHCQNQSMELIRRGGWDVVVLQEQSQYPAFPDEQVDAEVLPYARQLVAAIYSASPCAEPMFYMTWGRKNGDQYNGTIFPPIGTYEGMDSLLALRYQMMADENDASLCPVGRVWHRLRQDHPEIELYQADDSHPSLAGSYAAACAFYTLMFRKNPSDIRYDAGLDERTATTIREVVGEVVYSDIHAWLRPQPQGLPEWDDTTRYMTESFRLTTDRADTVRILWGDGTDTLFEAAPRQTVAHTYADTGSYAVSLIVSRHCLQSEQSWVFTATQETGEPVGIAPAKANTLNLRPNPASSQVELAFDDQPLQVEILDAQGRLLERHYPHGFSQRLEVTHLPAGLYLVRATTANGVSTARLIIR